MGKDATRELVKGTPQVYLVQRVKGQPHKEPSGVETGAKNGAFQTQK